MSGDSLRGLVRDCVLEAVVGFPGGTPEEIAELAAGFIVDEICTALFETWDDDIAEEMLDDLENAAEWVRD